MQYADIIATQLAAAAYLEAEHAGKIVLTDHPLTSDLGVPALGYVH
jgi:hypothetical protein